MLIPKQIVALSKIAARHDSRYALTSVRIERHRGKARAIATDSRRAVIFSWEEPDAGEFPPIAGMSPLAVADFAVNVPPRTLADAVRGVAVRSPKPILGFVLLDESNRKTVRLASTTLDNITRAEAPAQEAAFPPVVDVIPHPGRRGGLYDAKIHGEQKFTHVRVAINGRQVAETLAAMADLAADDPETTIVLTVPINPARPLRLDARSADRCAVGTIMPVNANFSIYSEWEDQPQDTGAVRTPTPRTKRRVIAPPIEKAA